jgi:hypothetical protein
VMQRNHWTPTEKVQYHIPYWKIVSSVWVHSEGATLSHRLLYCLDSSKVTKTYWLCFSESWF